MKKKKCKRCLAIYETDEVGCRWHPGQFVVPEHLEGRMAQLRRRWSCCGAFEESGPGCHSASAHDEDPAFTAALDRIAIPTPTGGDGDSSAEKQTAKSELPDAVVPPMPDACVEEDARTEAVRALARKRLAEIYALRREATRSAAVAAAEKTQGGSASVHEVDPARDTVQGLAIACGITPEEFRRLNKLGTDSELYTRQWVLMTQPVVTTSTSTAAMTTTDDEERKRAEEMRKSLVAQVIAQGKCTPQEAESYLALSDWNISAALAAMCEDAAWESAQRKPK